MKINDRISKALHKVRGNSPLILFHPDVLTRQLFSILPMTQNSNKRDAITRLIRNNKIVRIKKVLYIFGSDERKGLVCKEVLANQIYGPSYISLEYALSFYGLIPERVERLTSVTTGKTRIFNTPLGFFSYRRIPKKKFTVGVTLQRFDEYRSVFMAEPERAILDLVYFSKRLPKKTDLERYFEEDLRIEISSLKELSLPKLIKIADQLSHERITRVVDFIKGLHNYA